jgi:peptidoglycan hydrolase-like protein with peptidoglycan-binding domain
VSPSVRRSFVSVVAVLAVAAPIVAAPGALASSPTQSARLGDRTLRPGAHGPDVRELQKALGRAGFRVEVDGEFGTDTLAAVKRFQRASHLTPSGIVGRKTIAALERAMQGTDAGGAGGSDSDAADSAQNGRSLGDRVPVQRGMNGHDIRVLQDFLTRAGFKVAIDGHFGADTEKAVEAFEAAQSRPVDGVIDAGDIDALRARAAQPEPPADATPTTPASQSTPATPGERAQIAPGGLASAPASAPDPVKAIIAAANKIATKPYRYGGGHGKWNDSGYDCSGSMSYALHGAGLLDAPLTSGGFADWGETGAGQWVTIYANAGHSYMVVAGLRFDTSGRSKAGTRWQTEMRSTRGYAVRHPAGL